MIDRKLFPKAYVEVLEIIKYIPKKEYDKIPQYILQNMENEKDVSYTYTVTYFDNFQEQRMLKETEAILAVFYRDYWSTPYQKERIKAKKEKYDMEKLEEEKRKKYNSNNLFKDRNEEKHEKLENIDMPVEVKKESFLKQLISYIKGLFN